MPRICPNIFTKEDQRLAIYDVTWFFVVELACCLFWICWSPFVICFLKASVYAAGFPCTPYSLLSCTRKMLHDQNARQLFRVIKRLRKYRPKASWINYVVSVASVFWSYQAVFLIIAQARFISHVCWTLQVAALENVLGFRPILGKVISLIRANVPGQCGCISICFAFHSSCHLLCIPFFLVSHLRI